MKAITKNLVPREEFDRFKKALLAIVIEEDKKCREAVLARVRDLVGIDPHGESDWVPVSDLEQAHARTGDVLIQREKLRQALGASIGFLEELKPVVEAYRCQIEQMNGGADEKSTQQLSRLEGLIKTLRLVQTV